jgi:rRNA maturation RNase YbeY
MIIRHTNLHRGYRIDRPALHRLARDWMARAAALDPTRPWAELSVVFVGHSRMTRLNREALGHEGTTDVITFAYAPLPGDPLPGWRGEVVVNLDEAAAVSARLHQPLAREAALYLAHGCQHLGGADDHTPVTRAAMHRRQTRWLRLADPAALATLVTPRHPAQQR